MSHPFDCIDCAPQVVSEKGGSGKDGLPSTPAIPIIRTDSGVVRHVAVGGSPRSLSDEEVLGDPQFIRELISTATGLGLRFIPSLAQEVAANVTCNRCKCRIISIGFREVYQSVLATRYLPMAAKGQSAIGLAQAMFLKCYLFETGAILGRARSEELDMLTVTLSQPRREHDVKRHIQGQTAELTRQCGDCRGLHFFDFHQRVGNFDVQEAMGAGKSKLPLATAHGIGQVGFLSGVGFGSTHPVETEQMYRATIRTD